MNRTLIALALAGALAGLGAGSADACTSMIFKAEDGTRIYARTMEWGASDLKSECIAYNINDLPTLCRAFVAAT